jgi:alpha-L-arabinofuranosidase
VEDIEYRLKLEVTGRRIRTWVNGVQWNDTVDRLPELEELYVTASIDEDTGKTYVKAVNLTGEEKEVQIDLTGEEKKTVEIISFTADSLAAENTFENPDRVVPKSSMAEVKDNQLVYTFPAHSVTVLAYL